VAGSREAPDQHSGWRWQDLQDVALAEDVHPYVRAFAQWLLDRDLSEQHLIVHQAIWRKNIMEYE
jgi:hypothetical protein